MKWKTLQHNGILFPPAFVSQGIKLKIKGENVPLNLLQEEMIYQWAKKKDTPYAQDKVFQKNFVADFGKTLPSKFKKLGYSDLDFSAANKIVDKEKDARERITKEGKKALTAKRKKIREEMKEKFGKAIMDGKEVEVASYMAEPPGIFIGRGEHPLRGKWKPRVTPKEVILNLGKDAKIPKGDWGKIIHDKDSMWLASWMDVLTQKRKYVWLADTAGLKQERDQPKTPEGSTQEPLEQTIQPEGGGCLIATAAFGSEFAPQVQMLREIRDNMVLNTASGTSFMTAFNLFYYSFSPIIADMERENEAFKETVKFAITPLLTSLSLLNHVDIDSEEEMLFYGIGIILLNIGMYFAAPAFVLNQIRKTKFTSKIFTN